MTATWNDVRRNLGDRLNRLDYAALADVAAGKVRKTDSGRSMVQFRIVGGKWEYKPISMRKLLGCGLVTDPPPGGEYATTGPGAAALEAWRARRPAPLSPNT